MWSEPFVRIFRHQPDVYMKAPAVAEDLVHVHLTGATGIYGTLVRPFSRRALLPGDIFIVPRGEPAEWECTESMDVLQRHQW